MVAVDPSELNAPERPNKQFVRCSLADMKELHTRTQITSHDWVEGWSSIGKLIGVPIGPILKAAGAQLNARYAVSNCADELEQSLDGSGKYYESIDLIDASHPWNILAYGMNGKDLEVAHSSPLRLRVERHLR